MKSKQWSLFLAIICLSILIGIPTARIVTAKPDSQVKTVLLEDVKWENNLDIAGIQTAKVIGNPGSAELYILLNKMSQRVVLPVHTHPDDRITTVLSGVIYYGTGEFDSQTAKPYPAGSIIYTRAQTPHYLWAKDEETIMQQTGVGPTKIDF